MIEQHRAVLIKKCIENLEEWMISDRMAIIEIPRFKIDHLR